MLEPTDRIMTDAMATHSTPMKWGTLAIVGRPNVGKSTLLNALIQQKIAIVSDKPQTTRTRIMGVGHYPSAQLVVIDTPGVHKPHHRLNTKMVQTALGTLEEADVVYVMVDASRSPGPGDRFVIDAVDAANRSHPYYGVFLLLNKVDLVKKSTLLPLIAEYDRLRPWTAIIPISAHTGCQLDRLLTVTLACLPESDIVYFEDDYVTDQPVRQLAAELIREQVLEHTRDELPYAVAVRLDEFLEEDKLVRIAATIFVDKPSQKAIVIGKRGHRLKEIATHARRAIEDLLHKHVYLKVWVKVQAGWRDNERILTELGY